MEKTRSGRTSQSSYTPPPREARAKQRAFVVGAFPEGDLDELKRQLDDMRKKVERLSNGDK